MSKALRFLSSYPAAISLFLCFSILALRCADRLQFPVLWAEDAGIYLSDVYDDPAKSLVTPFAGYYQIIPRLIAGTLYLIAPIDQIPLWTNLLCLFFLAATFSIFAGPGFRWLVPSAGIRVLATLAFCFLPGLEEIAGNMANLAGICMFLLAIIFLKDVRVPFSLAEILLGLMAIFTQGACLLFAPAALWRIKLKRKLFASRTAGWQEAIFLTAILLATIYAIQTGGSVHNPKSHDFAGYIIVEIRVFITQFILFPLTGDFTREWLAFLAAPFLLRFLREPLRSFSDGEKILLYGVLLGTLAYPFLTFLVREGSSAAYAGGIGTAEFRTSRYAFLLPAVSLVYWLTVLIRLRPAGHDSRLLPVALLSLFIALALPRFTIPRLEGYSEWSSRLPELLRSAATGCPQSVKIQAAPPGWFFTYKSPLVLQNKQKGLCEKL